MESNNNNTENIQYQRPIVSEMKYINNNNILLAVLIGLLLITSFPLILNLFTLQLIQVVLILLIYLVCYSIILFFLLQPTLIREINHLAIKTVEIEKPTIKYIDRPVIKEKIIEKPVYNEVIVEKPVYRDIERPIYINNKKLNIPKYEFLGSSETKTFHKRNCRFSKLIKKKYKISNNQKKYFTSRNFKPCKLCIK